MRRSMHSTRAARRGGSESARRQQREVGLAHDGRGGEAAAALREVGHACDEGEALELDAAHDERVAEAVRGALGHDDDDHQEGQGGLRVAHLEQHDAEAHGHAHLACMHAGRVAVCAVYDMAAAVWTECPMHALSCALVAMLRNLQH